MKDIKYYVEFKDADGKFHYAVHTYDRLSGIVTAMKDLKFEDANFEIDFLK